MLLLLVTQYLLLYRLAIITVTVVDAHVIVLAKPGERSTILFDYDQEDIPQNIRSAHIMTKIGEIVLYIKNDDV